VSTFALLTLGFEAYREGNQIDVCEMHMGVVDACSGLRMLTIFIALSVALVLVGGHDWYENAAILASAIPIALIVNSVRITVTGVLYQFANSEVAEMVFHDLAGWFMMPMALGMLYLVQLTLSHLFYESEDKGLVTLSGGVSVSPAERPRFGKAPLPVDPAGQGHSVPEARR
jgi:exosortase